MSRPLRAEAPSVDVHLRFSPAELVRIDRAAKVNHQTRSEFGREAVKTAVSDCIDDDIPGVS